MLTVLLWMLMAAQAGSTPPIASNVAPACTSRATCTFTDNNVPSGPHFYFIEAVNATGSSLPSNKVDAVVPAGTHNAVLSWDPDASPAGISYKVFRGAPASNLRVTSTGQ